MMNDDQQEISWLPAHNKYTEYNYNMDGKRIRRAYRGCRRRYKERYRNVKFVEARGTCSKSYCRNIILYPIENQSCKLSARYREVVNDVPHG